MFKEGQKVKISSEAGSFRETEHYVTQDQSLWENSVWVCSKAPDDKPFRVHQKHLTLAEGNTVPTALAAMVQKIDNRRPGTRGYVTNRDELIAILQEVTPLISVGIYASDYQVGNDISVEIRLSLTLERELL